MKSFDEVTRDAQRERLKHLGEMALQRYGIENAKLTFICDKENTVFRIDTLDQQQYVLRISNPQMLMRLEVELLWLLALQTDTALSVPEPIPAQDGTLVQVIATEGIPETRCVTLLRWVPGQILDDQPTPNLLTQMGAFMAQLHNHTEQFALPDGITLPHTSWDKLRYWQDHQNNTSATLTTEQRNLCAVASQRLLAEIEQIGTGAGYGLIHADLHLRNCVVYQGRLRVIDFADCRIDSHFYDIAVPLTKLVKYQNYEALCSAFYEGYSSVRALAEHYEAAVETFMTARSFDIIEWIHSWPSPTHFGFGPGLLSSSIQQIRYYVQ